MIISGDNLTIDQLNDIALDEIQILRENDISNTSDYEEIVFSDAFQKKYHNIMGFDKTGMEHVLFSERKCQLKLAITEDDCLFSAISYKK